MTPPDGIGAGAGPGSDPITAADLETVARTRVFFGHQSVGDAVLAAIPDLFAAHGVAAPPIRRTRTRPGTAGGFVAETPVGDNGHPFRKMTDFDEVIRGGLGGSIDVAVLKLCYADVTPATDVTGVFAAYRDTLRAIERDFPGLACVGVTVALTTHPTLVHRVKQRLDGNEGYGAAANAARERLNQLIRREWGRDRLLDLAAAESTGADGSMASGRHRGQRWYALHRDNAVDSGHLNRRGARLAALNWLSAVARVSER